VRRILAGALLVGGAIAFLVLLAGPAAANDCGPTMNPQGCQNAATSAGVQAAVTGAIVAVAVGVGVSLGGPTVSTTTEQVVVSGKEAVDILVQQGGKTIPRDGKTYLVPPGELPGGVSGGYTTTTLPDGTKVVAPEDLAIVQNVPVPTGTTTTVQGGAAVNALVNEGFSTYTDNSGNVYVKTPPNLIHGNVTGVAYEGKTTVDGVEVIDPNKGVIVVQTGPSTVPPPTAGVTTTAVPESYGAGAATARGAPPAETKGAAPVEPAETKGAVEVTQPPRTPTDAKSLTSSLTQPGTTIITPGNVPAFAPEVLAPDGTIKVTNPKLPEVIQNLNGQKMPTPTISEGQIGVDLPGQLGHVDVSLRAEGGRLVSETETSGPIKGVEVGSMGANLMNPNVPEVDVGRAVQNRIDRYNRQIQDAGLEVKSVSAEGGQVRIVTGKK
jgi:hypothetical protein